jgi:uncharacterized membrane protein
VLNYICCLILFEIVSCIKPYDNHYFHGSLFNLKVAINQGWFTISRTFSFDTLLNSNVYKTNNKLAHDTLIFSWMILLHYRNFIMCKDKISQSSSCILFCWWNISRRKKKVRKEPSFWFIASA